MTACLDGLQRANRDLEGVFCGSRKPIGDLADAEALLKKRANRVFCINRERAHDGKRFIGMRKELRALFISLFKGVG
jgi:hypothetical protein